MRCFRHYSHLIVTWSHRVFFVTSIGLLCICLADQLSIFIFLVSKYIVVRWNRWRVWHQDLLLIRLRPSVVLSSLRVPVFRFIVLSWSWYYFRSLCAQSIFKPFDLWREGVMRFDQLNSKLIEAELLQGLCTLHSSVYVIETVGRMVCTRA